MVVWDSAALSDVDETKVVARSVPSQRTIEPLTKFVPVTVNVAGGAVIEKLAGDTELMLGVGFATVTVIDAEDPPPGDGVTTPRM